MPNDPTTVSGLRGRWRASTISSPPSDGADLTSFTDTAGSSYHATTYSGGTAPIYRSSGAFLPNSKPVVEYVAANTDESTAPVPNNTATTKFVVARLKTLPTGGVWAPFAAMTNGYSMLTVSTGKFGVGIATVTWLVDPASNPGGVTLSTGTWYVLTISGNNSNSATSWVNGTQDGTSSTSHSSTATRWNFGGREFTGDNLDGYIAEVLDYSAVLSAGDRATVHSYIQEEYGITVSDYAPATVDPEGGPATSIHRSGRRGH